MEVRTFADTSAAASASMPGGFLLGVLVASYPTQRVVNTAPLLIPGAIPTVEGLDQEDTAPDTQPEVGRGAERASAHRVSVYQERAKAPNGQHECGYSWQHAVSPLRWFRLVCTPAGRWSRGDPGRPRTVGEDLQPRMVALAGSRD